MRICFSSIQACNNFKKVYCKTIKAPWHQKANIWHEQERKRKHRRKKRQEELKRKCYGAEAEAQVPEQMWSRNQSKRKRFPKTEEKSQR